MVKFFDEVFFPEIQRHNIKYMFHLGDVFDKPRSVNFKTTSVFRKCFFDRLKTFDVESHFLVGNHDSFYQNTNEINSLSTTFNGMQNVDNLHFYWDKPKVLDIGGKRFLLCPWINESNYESFKTGMERENINIVAGHFEFYGFLHTKSGHVSDHGFNLKDFKQFDRVWSGHYHHQQQQGNVHYLGTPYEMIWDDYDDPKGFHIYDTEIDELKFYKNPNRLFERIEYDDNIDIKEVQKKIENKIVTIYVKEDFDEKLFTKNWKRIQEVPNHGIKFVDNRYIQSLSLNIEIEKLESTPSLCEAFVDSRENIPDSIKSEGKKLLLEIYEEAVK